MKSEKRVFPVQTLYTRRANGIINNLRLTDADWNSRLDTRSVTLAFSYRFGKTIGNKPKHIGSGSDTEQQRVKDRKSVV